MSRALGVALVALAPTLGAWLVGRGARGTDAALMPVQRTRRRNLTRFTLAVCLVLALGFSEHAFWAVPLALAGRFLGSLPARRAALGASWHAPAFVAHRLRVMAADGGFWLLLYVTPIVVVWYPPWGPALWPFLALTLALWIPFWTSFTLFFLGARRLERPELLERLRALSAHARGPEPTVWRAGTRAGRWLTVVSLPALRRPAVLFSDAVLDLLELDEIAALHAHELAHLEHLDARSVQRHNRSLAALVAVAVLAPLLPLDRAQVLAGWTLLLSVVVFVWANVRRARSPARETECDIHALRLGASPLALERALVKLHAAAGLPERWSQADRRRSSHPSLAQRVEAIRGWAAAEDSAAARHSSQKP